MDLKSLLENNEPSSDYYLYEGIKFFKNSKRLDKLAKKIRKRALRLPNKHEAEKRTLAHVVATIENLGEKFYKLERVYGGARLRAEKTGLKERYQKLERDNYELVKLINKETTLKALKLAGALTLVGIVIGSTFIHLDALASINQVEAQLEVGSEKLRDTSRFLDDTKDARSRLNQVPRIERPFREYEFEGKLYRWEELQKKLGSDIEQSEEKLQELENKIGSLGVVLNKQTERQATSLGGVAGGGIAGFFTALTSLVTKRIRNKSLAQRAKTAVQKIETYQRKG